MNIDVKEGYKVLTPDKGKVLTNGATTATEVTMPLSVDTSVWRDTEPPMEGEEITDSEALTIITNR